VGLEAFGLMPRAASDPDDADLRALAAAVRRLRAKRRVSQEQLSLEAGLHRNYVGRLERAELSPTFEPLVSIARALGVAPGELMGYYERELP
jgi:transcriptional regulator with XRE-family HTH domain